MKVERVFRLLIALCLLSTLSVSFVLAGGQKEEEAAVVEPIELKAVSFGPLTHSNAVPLQQFIDRINERSGGELVVKYLGATEITALYDQPEALRGGVFDLLVIFPAAYVGILPLAAGINLGNLDPPDWHARGAHDYLVEMHKAINIRYLGSFASYKHGQYLFLKNEISKPEDIAGLKFATGPTNLLAIAAWGGSGVRVALGEKYSALERGMVDGVAGDLVSQHDDSLYEVTRYWLPYSLGSALSCMLMNEESWNSLPAHLQDLVTEVMIELEKEATTNLEASAKATIEKLVEAGMKTIEFAPAVAREFLEVSLDAKWADIAADPAELNALKDLLNQ